MTLDPTKRGGLKPIEAKFLADIESYGWAVTKIFIPAGEEGIDFAYSTGLYSKFGEPEIVIFGLPLDAMHRIINIVANQIKSGVKFAPNQDYNHLIERHYCQFKIVDRSQYEGHFARSSWFYGSQDYPVLQCFWPDKSGYFPWQAECNPGIRKLQTPLYLPISNEGERVQ